MWPWSMAQCSSSIFTPDCWPEVNQSLLKFFTESFGDYTVAHFLSVKLKWRINLSFLHQHELLKDAFYHFQGNFFHLKKHTIQFIFTQMGTIQFSNCSFFNIRFDFFSDLGIVCIGLFLNFTKVLFLIHSVHQVIRQ